MLLFFTRSGVMQEMNSDKRKCGTVWASCFHCLISVISMICIVGKREEAIILCRIEVKTTWFGLNNRCDYDRNNGTKGAPEGLKLSNYNWAFIVPPCQRVLIVARHTPAFRPVPIVSHLGSQGTTLVLAMFKAFPEARRAVWHQPPTFRISNWHILPNQCIIS